MLAHKASHEGFIAAEAIAGHKVAFEPRAIPAVVFTDPEMAWCGLTETQAKSQNRSVEVVRFPWRASGRATTLGRNDGLTKLLIDPETERILDRGDCWSRRRGVNCRRRTRYRNGGGSIRYPVDYSSAPNPVGNGHGSRRSLLWT